MTTLNSLADLSKYLEKIIKNFEPLEKEYMGIIGEALEKSAKDKFGVYQRSDPEYQEWEELAESTKADRLRKNYPENEPLLREGTLRDSVHHVISPSGNELVVYSDDEIMVYQEMGTAHIPPRSVLGLTAFESRDKVEPILAQMMVSWMTDKKLNIKKPD